MHLVNEANIYSVSPPKCGVALRTFRMHRACCGTSIVKTVKSKGPTNAYCKASNLASLIYLAKLAGKRVQELPVVLWSLGTTPNRPTGFIIFFLVYGADAIIPTDLEYRSPRVRAYNEETVQKHNKTHSIDSTKSATLRYYARQSTSRNSRSTIARTCDP